MIRREPTHVWKAGLLLVIGSALGLAGLLLSAGESFTGRAVNPDPSSALASILHWGPTTLVAAGGTLAAAAAVLIGMDWLHRKS